MREVNLPLAGRVPGGVQQEEMVGSSEVQSDSTRLRREKSVKRERGGLREKRTYLETEQHHGGTVLPVALEHLHGVRAVRVRHRPEQENKIKYFNSQIITRPDERRRSPVP